MDPIAVLFVVGIRKILLLFYVFIVFVFLTIFLSLHFYRLVRNPTCPNCRQDYIEDGVM
jgi:hypothetical protein